MIYRDFNNWWKKEGHRATHNPHCSDREIAEIAWDAAVTNMGLDIRQAISRRPLPKDALP